MARKGAHEQGLLGMARLVHKYVAEEALWGPRLPQLQ